MEPFIGQISTFGFNFAPRGWAFCNGQILAIQQHTALFSLLGTTFGGDGRSSFGLPDLRGRTIVHPGQGIGLSAVHWGQSGGAEQVTLTIPQLPSHNHIATIRLGDGRGLRSDGENKFIAEETTMTPIWTNRPGSKHIAHGSVSTGNVGASQPIGIRNPYLGLHVSIALIGIFPSRS